MTAEQTHASGWKTWHIVTLIALWLVINVVGTIFYTRIRTDHPHRGLALVSVFVGWLLFAPANLLSPILATGG